MTDRDDDVLVPNSIRDPARTLWEKCGRGALREVVPIPGGRNNRVFRVVADDITAILKSYHSSTGGRPDRFDREIGWYQYCQTLRVPAMAELWGSDRSASVALFSELPGRKLRPDQVTEESVQQAVNYFVAVNARRSDPSLHHPFPSVDAAFSLADHESLVERRWQRLQAVVPVDEPTRHLHSWLAHDASRVWSQVRDHLRKGLSPEAMNTPIERRKWCLSPSDFGFHNALQDEPKRLWFVDFEYAGWDDPAKMICDFYWQIDVPAPRSTYPLWLDVLRSFDPQIEERIRRLFPLIGLKWCAIVLNEFLDDGQQRRSFARGHFDGEDRRFQQAALANQLLAEIERSLIEGQLAIPTVTG